jgi:hypothetical protein
VSRVTRLARKAALETAVTLWGGSALRLRCLDREKSQGRNQLRDDETHLRAALSWIARAQDAGYDDGVSAMYSCLQGWQGSYPETTGYIIPTLYAAAAELNESAWRERAWRMAEWLLTKQCGNGGFPGLFDGRLSEPRVFNTGQIIFGLLRTFEETHDARFLDSARRAGDWLIALQDDDGAWRRWTYNGIVHTYNTRTAWALVRLGHRMKEPAYCTAACRNAAWAIRQQTPMGWFRHNGFETNGATHLHTIVYAMRGLLEIGDACGEKVFIESATRCADVLHGLWQREGRIPGAFDEEWSRPAAWSCLPGGAQLVIAWLRLDQIHGARRYRSSACALLDHVKASQLLGERNPGLAGGVTGSFPVNGDYERYCVVNWGAKFLADAILLKRRVQRQERKLRRSPLPWPAEEGEPIEALTA